jgi:hypothetical protein
MIQFINQLANYIQTAFNNEKEFIKEFGDVNDYEVFSIHMASGQTRISMFEGLKDDDDLSLTPQDRYISTEDFINWCDSINS